MANQEGSGAVGIGTETILPDEVSADVSSVASRRDEISRSIHSCCSGEKTGGRGHSSSGGTCSPPDTMTTARFAGSKPKSETQLHRSRWIAVARGC